MWMAMLATLLTMAASSGVVAGVLTARKKTKALALIGPLEAGTIPEPAEPAVRRKRKGKLHRHDYDLMIGRTFFR
jgi:uncharacterized membrane protein YcjF (UPF0283 family)